jgi:hypothetical protein
MGNVKIFRHPRVCVRTVVLVVTSAAGVFSTLVVSLVRFLEKENTFFGARSSGFSTIVVPVEEFVSVNSSELDAVLSSPLSSEEVVEVKLEREEELIRLDREVEADDVVSTSTNADLTSVGSEVQASNIEADRVA